MSSQQSFISYLIPKIAGNTINLSKITRPVTLINGIAALFLKGYLRQLLYYRNGILKVYLTWNIAQHLKSFPKNFHIYLSCFRLQHRMITVMINLRCTLKLQMHLHVTTSIEFHAASCNYKCNIEFYSNIYLMGHPVPDI